MIADGFMGPAQPAERAAECPNLLQSIQPHGLLLVLTEPELVIEYASENLQAFVGVAAVDVCGVSILTLLREDEAQTVTAKLRGPQHLTAGNAHRLTICGPAGQEMLVECVVQRREFGGLIVELEPADADIERPVYSDVQAPIERLQAAPDIAALVESAALDIQQMSGFDRVLVYRFESDWRGEIVAEATAAWLEQNYLGLYFPASDMPERSRTAFLRNALRCIPDTAYIPAPLVSCASPAAEPLDLSRAILRGAAPQRLEYLRNMGSRATLTISIVVRGRLWGLITCHHRSPRRLGHAQRSVCELMGHMLAWQLGARIDAQAEQQDRRDAALTDTITAELQAHDNIGAALGASMSALLELFSANGIAVRIAGTTLRCGNAPLTDGALSAIASALSTPAGVAATHDVCASAAIRSAAAAGALRISLTDASDDWLLIFRPEVIHTIIWVGAPRQPRARLSHESAFEPWRETVRNQSALWTAEDIAAAQALASRIRQRRQHLRERRAARISNLNAHLEERNAQAEALIKLQDDVAVALPSRASVISIILEFAVRETGADGSVLERLEEPDTVYEAAAGSLAQHTGLRVPRAASLSGISLDLQQALVCDDTSTDVEDVDRTWSASLHIGSMIVVPIAVSASSNFVLKVVSARRSAFSTHDSQTLKLAATNLVSALRAAQKFTAMAAAELEQRTYARQLRALHTIASTTTSNRKDQIEAALYLGLAQLGLDWAYLGIIDATTQELVFETSVSRNGRVVAAAGTRMPLAETLMAQAGNSKRVFIVNDVSKLPTPPLVGGWNAYIAVPLFIGGVMYGAIGFTSTAVRSEPFSDANIEFLAVAGELIASAIERGLQRDQLEHGQTRHQALIEAIPQMMWVVDAGNQFEYVNERWTQYTGLTLEQSRAVGRDGIYHAADFAAVPGAPLPADLEFEREVRLRRADGAYHWHLVRSVPFGSVAGDAGRWLVTATDIEARKSAETLLADVHDAALAATEAKSRFLATMSHEIRTPMNGVIGMTEMLLLTSLNDEQREYTEIIRDSGQSLLRVLNDILDYSKIEAGKLQLETVQFDLPGQVESVVVLLRPGYTGKGVRLTTQIDPDVQTAVVGDPGRLRQILLNLAGNALKFTAAGGEVQIVVSTIPAAGDLSPVRVTIKDTGIGIPPEVVARLFQPFSQGDESTTRKFGGTGLGLSISAELVGLMGGEIGVQSEPDVGSNFWFVIPFPLAPNSQKVADDRQRLQPRSEPAPLRAERVLLVEDNEINTFLALKQLQRLGFAVTSVTNGRQAVETVGRERYDLVLMDCHMPEMDGFEATRVIRRLENATGPHLPIVAMTADARDEDHQNCLLAGMDDYISKPTNLDSLKAVLDRWMPAPERRRAIRNGTALFSTAPTLGMSMLLELFNGDRGSVLDLLAAALGAINDDIKRIEAAVAGRDFETVADAAQRLKGTSGSIRSGRLVEIGAGIEAEARATPAGISSTLLAELRAAVAAVTAEIQHQQRKSTADPATVR